ncbi:MAG: YtxH domain-containing protein [Acidobacteria bacterium]|nr:YtxH domain-containing protein [Acidobacteriota bacterium]
MAENGGAKFGYFLAGLGIGAAIGILFAPRSGEETREYLRERYDDTRDLAKRKAREIKDRTDELVEKGKDFVERQRESVEAAVDAGKQAYRDEKRRM